MAKSRVSDQDWIKSNPSAFCFLKVTVEKPLLAREEFERSCLGKRRRCCWCRCPLPKSVLRFVGKGSVRRDIPFFCRECAVRRRAVQELLKAINVAIEAKFAEMSESERLTMVWEFRRSGHPVEETR